MLKLRLSRGGTKKRPVYKVVVADSQMKVLNKAKNDFDNIEYFTFDVTNKEIAKLFDVQYQTTLLIFKDNKEVYRSIGETTKDLIYKAIKSSI